MGTGTPGQNANYFKKTEFSIDSRRHSMSIEKLVQVIEIFEAICKLISFIRKKMGGTRS
jgi:hypothetical protein